MKRRKRYALLSCLFFCGLLYSCKSAPPSEEDNKPPPQETDNGKESGGTAETAPAPSAPAAERFTLLFAGDIMAHNVNYRMKDYSAIWADVKDEVSRADVSFANLEMPIDDDLPLSSYPQFNVHSSYVAAAIAAGFNAFSLVNNHTNDWLLDGIEATRKWAEKTAAETKESIRPVYFSGLKSGAKEGLSYAVIDAPLHKADEGKDNGKDGDKTESGDKARILFLAVTEILNRPNYSAHINYIGIDRDSRTAFVSEIKALRQNNPCDIFVLSFHANVPEYVHTIAHSRREWYGELLDAGVDVVWANHPHIVQDAVLDGEKLVMFACGNTISGQRTKPQFDNPAAERDWTGDGLMMKVTFLKEGDGSIKLEKAEKHFITTYITGDGYVIKNLDDTFIEALKRDGEGKWAKYLARRRELLNEVNIGERNTDSK